MEERPGSAATLREAALQFARYGWHVFPCKPDKTPWTEHGFLDASTDSPMIDAWWSKRPNALIGIACGPSHLAVLDHDPRHDPDGWGQAMLEDLVGDVVTREARSPQGGRHLYFTVPEDVTVKSSVGALGPGLDVRAVGGYVIAPPSESEKGRYCWANRVAVAPIPPAFLEAAMATAAPKKDGAVQDPSEQGIIPDGRRDVTLASMAGTLWRRGLSPLAIEAALVVEDAEHCKPPLGEERAREIARNIVKREGGNPYEGPMPPADTSEPTIELLGIDSVRVGVLLSSGSWGSFTFTEMAKERRELACHLSLAFLGAPSPYQQRLNLESSSARTELRRELDNLYGKDHGWGHALNTVWNLARDTYMNQDRSIRATDIPLVLDAPDLISPIMPAGGTTILFGDGSAGKSFIALALALSGATQIPVAGEYTVPAGDVMYIDCEDDELNFRRRHARLLAGLGLPPSAGESVHYWSSGGDPLRDQIAGVAQQCRRHACGWVIVDSAVAATHGAPEEADAARQLSSALRTLGLPCLLIAHITKSDSAQQTQKPFGSVFYHNFARRTWYVARTQEEASETIDAALFCRKTNDGERPRPIGLRLHFAPDRGPVTIESCSIDRNPELVRHTSAQNQIWGVLDKPLSIRDIAEMTGLPEATVRVTLKRHTDRFREGGEITLITKGGTQTAKLWGRASLNDDEITF